MSITDASSIQTIAITVIVSLLVGSISGVVVSNMMQPEITNGDPADDPYDHSNLANVTHDHEPKIDERKQYHFTFEAYFEGFLGMDGVIKDAYNPTLIVEPHSNVTITLISGDSMPHDWDIDEFVDSSIVNPTHTEITFSFLVDIKDEGTYTYYCSIPGHYNTMNGQFIVGEGPQIEPARDLDQSVIKSPTDIPEPVGIRPAQDVEITLVTEEKTAKLDDGTSYTFWTFNGTVPGPLIRVRVGDNVTVHLKNLESSIHTHNVDFHAVNAHGGGAYYTNSAPGETTSFWFIPEWDGVFVYHCAAPHVPTHISKGMFGAISVEPAEGIPEVDKEFYVGQSEIYTKYPKGTKGHQEHDDRKQLDEEPDYVIFNGQVNALAQPEYQLNVTVNDTVRLFFAVGGPNIQSNFHMIGGVWDRVYYETNWTAPNMYNAETIPVTPGSALALEMDITRTGLFILVDHALSRTFDKGCLGYMYSHET